MESKNKQTKLSDYISNAPINKCFECGEDLNEQNCKFNERKTKYKYKYLCHFCYHQYLYYDNKN